MRRSFRLVTRRTSIALHRREWTLVEEVAARRGKTVKQLLLSIEASHPEISLPSAIRLTLLAFWRGPESSDGRIVAFPDAPPKRGAGRTRSAAARRIRG